jgi:hypothetical protein
MSGTGYASAGTLSEAAVPQVWSGAVTRSRFGDVAVVLFLLAQSLDGVFTYVGVITYGPGIEANPLISGLMRHFGEEAGLIGAKAVACALGIALHLRQVHGAVALLTAFYAAAALLPWAAILFL